MTIKLFLIIASLLFAVTVLCVHSVTPSVSRQKAATLANRNHPPELGLINDLDKVIQQRFLTTPQLGIRRIGPVPNPHFEQFEPNTEEEKEAVTKLQDGNWKVGIYLMGRRAYENPYKNLKDAKPLLVHYKLNGPVPVTANVKKRELASPKRLRARVDEAFEKFRDGDTYDFSLGKWTYVARPVRAREVCLKCHQDMFVTSKVGEKRYTYRRRHVGDTIGVLLYAFRKKV